MMNSVSLPLWLSIGLAFFVGLVAVWQVPRIRVRLSENYSAGRGESDKVSGFKHWGKLLIGLVLFVIVGALADAWLWTQKTYEMQGLYYLDTDKKLTDKKHNQSLPTSYLLKKPLWQLGFAPLPTLVTIPAGEFNMGSDKGSSDELPIHKITIPAAFSMSQHEITFEQYDYFVWRMQQAEILQSTGDKKAEYRYPYDESWGRGNRPVIYVSWQGAQAYTHWLSKQLKQQCRLASEAEWEYAAKTGTTTKYPWGDEASHDYANYGKDDCCGGLASGKDQWVNTAPVGSFPPNDFGLYDMHGNLFEWVQDPWHDDYKNSPNSNEIWEVDGDFSRRVLRGGSWFGTPDDLRSAFRFLNAPDFRFSGVGFRIVCSSH